MAFDALTVRVAESGSYRISDSTNGLSVTQRIGGTTIPVADLLLEFGTGTGQANALYIASRTVTATTADNINLTSLSMGGTTFSLTKVKYVLIAISGADGTKSLQVGPKGVSNAVQLGWGGTGATVYDTVITDREWKHPYAGWTVTATTADILGIYNPGASSVTYGIVIAGLD
jgi:hypothetical protein